MKRIDIRIATTLDDKGLASAVKSLRELEKLGSTTSRAQAQQASAAAKIAQAHARAATAAAKVAVADNQAAASAQRLAQAQSRSAQGAATAATAQQRYQTELARTATAQDRAAVAAIRRSQAETRAAKNGGLGPALPRTVERFSPTALAQMTGITLGPELAMQLAGATAEAVKLGQQATQVGRSFNELAKAGGSTGDALLQAMRAASGGEISDLNLQLAASKAAMLGVGNSAAELGPLLLIARDRAQRLGLDSTQAFNDLVEGLGKAEPEILDNLGLTVNLTQVYGAYAKELGTTAQALTTAQKSQALLNEVLRQAGDITPPPSDPYKQLAAELSNAHVAAGKLANTQLAPPTEDLMRVIGLLREMHSLIGQAQQLQGGGAAAAGIAAAAQQTVDTVARIAPMLAPFQQLRDALSQLRGGLEEIRKFFPPAAAAAEDFGTKVHVAGGKSTDAAEAARVHAAALADDAAAALLSAVEAEKLAQAKTLLEAQARAAAEAMLFAGAAGAAQAARLANSSSDVDKLALAYYNLGISAQTAANQALQAVQFAASIAPGLASAIPGLTTVLKGIATARVTGRPAFSVAEAPKKAAGSGGAARISEAQKTADRLTDIERDAARRLLEIDEKLAADRLAAQKRLGAALVESANAFAVGAEANDLDLVGATGEEATRLADRERAEADARLRTIAAVDEAQRNAAEQGAQYAEDVFTARQEQTRAQQQLDETYYAKQRELPKEAQGELTTQYDEATGAIAAQTGDRIALAQAEAQARVQAVDDERQAVLTAAADQATALGATGDAATAAAGQVEALAGSLRGLPTNVTTTVTVRTVNEGGGTPATATGGTRAAGGGTFLTAGPAHFTVGDNPGGVELVTVTPMSGAGRTRVGAGAIRMAGGGSAIVDNAANTARARLGGGTTPTFPAATKAARGAAAGANVAGAKDALEAEQKTLQLLLEIADLRERIGQVASEGAFDSNGAFANALRRLGDEAQFAAKVVKYRLLPLTDETAEDMNRYADVASGAIGVLGDALDLRERLLAGTLDSSAFGDQSDYANAIRRLGDEANFIARVVRYRLVPLTDVQAEAIGRYSDAVSSSVSALKDTLDLQASAFVDYTPPSAAQIAGLADDASRIVAAVSRAAATYDTKGLDAAQKFSDALGSTVGAFTDTLKFNEGLLFTEAVRPDSAKLKQFAAGASAILDVTKGLATQAQAIPASGLAALQTATSAITAQAEALIRMAAVPFADLPRISGAFGAAGSGSVGGGGPTINIYNPPANLNVPALIAQIKAGLQQDVAARR